MSDLKVNFFEYQNGNKPVYEWLKEQPIKDRKKIEFEIQRVRYGFTSGRGNFANISGVKKLWEIKVSLTSNRIARIFFCISDNTLVLLHGIIKKSQKTPIGDIKTAKNRMGEI